MPQTRPPFMPGWQAKNRILETQPVASADVQTALADIATALVKDRNKLSIFELTNLIFLRNSVLSVLPRVGTSPLKALKQQLAKQIATENRFLLGDFLAYLFLTARHELTPRDFALIDKMKPNVKLGIVITLITEDTWFQKGAEAQIERLLRMVASLPLDNCKSYDGLHHINALYMYTSYANFPDKHRPKAVISAYMENLINRIAPFKTPPIRKISSQKPRLVIVAEVLTPGHAVFRCYAPFISMLKNDFETHLILHKHIESPVFDTLTDDVHYLENFSDIGAIDRLMTRLEPDALYIPSVGMSLMTLCMVNRRYCPVQITGLGHPSTSAGKAADYIVMLEDFYSEDAWYTEKPILHNISVRYYAPDTKAIEVAASKGPRNDGRTLIAVPAFVKKLSEGFVRTLREILDDSDVPITFRFFPNTAGVRHHYVAAELQKILPCEVMPRKSYKDYMNDLGECDFSISPFPFGNTNGLIDAFSLGLPNISLLGEESHSRIDASLAARSTQPDWLSAKSVADFKAGIMRLILNKEERQTISRQLLDMDMDKRFFTKDGHELKALASLFKAIVLEHQP